MNNPNIESQDLSQCEQELIHIPEAIQPYGALLVINHQSSVVRTSLNIEQVTGLTTEYLTGRNVRIIFGDKFNITFEKAILRLNTHEENSYTFIEKYLNKKFKFCIYLSDEFIVLELSQEEKNSQNFLENIVTLRQSLSELRQLDSLNLILERISHHLRLISNFDRVMVYQFNKNFDGEVIAEARSENLESYLGLHYPASDIPQQARALYLKNTIRIIQDVDYTPCRLSGTDFPFLDMTHSSLRSVSPFHIKYLQNMGVKATLVTSLVIDGQLWGLISCHHYTTKSVNYELYELFRLVSLLVANEIRLIAYKKYQFQSFNLNKITQNLLNNLRNSDKNINGLFESELGTTLLKVANSDGVACIFKNQILNFGSTPDLVAIKHIYHKLQTQNTTGQPQFLYTESLSKLLEESPVDHPNSAGLIAVPIQKIENGCLLFFRKEYKQIVRWGGNPNKAVFFEGGQLTPRASFEEWKQSVTGYSKEWQPAELEAAEKFAAAIDIEFRKQAEAELHLLRSSIAHLNDIVIITEAEPFAHPGPKILFVNEAFERHTGYTASEVLGKTPRILQGPNTSRETLDVLRKNLESWKDSRVVLQNYTKAGKAFWTELQISPVANSKGWFTHWIAVQRDVTKQKLTEDTLRFIAQKGLMRYGNDFLEELCNFLSELLDINYIMIGKVTTDYQTIHTHMVYALGKVSSNFSYPLKDTPCENVVNKKECAYPHGVRNHFPDNSLLKEWNIEGYIGVPIWNSEGSPLGLITLMNKTPIFNADLATSVLSIITNRVESELMRQESDEYIWHQANFDALTDLPNRRMFQFRLDQEFKKAQRSSFMMALLYLDIDKFKEVNDGLGHEIGDLLLIEVAKRLKQCVRESDTVARLGGDEFTIIITDVNDIQFVESIASKILNLVSQPLELANEHLNISVSIGITIYPDDSINLETLKKNADQAMYDAKLAGRNRYSFFTLSMQQAVNHRILIARELRSAVKESQFSLVYQPILNLQTGKITKAEALIRWQHPELGTIMPNEFISIAEDNRLICSIGDWVFKEVCNNLNQIRKIYNSEFRISVNKSPLQFRSDDNYHINWFEHIQKIGLPGDAIIIEITESSMLETTKAIQNKFHELHLHGFKIAIDDFGTGYSAMSYLNKFDIDYLKIDRTFIMNLYKDSQNFILCEAIVAMAHKLGMEVIAEGVETIEQLELLKVIGVDFCQGYLISRPIILDELKHFICQDYNNLITLKS